MKSRITRGHALNFANSVVQLVKGHSLGIFKQTQRVAQHVFAGYKPKGGIDVVAAHIVNAAALVQGFPCTAQAASAGPLLAGSLRRRET